jgi:hypothetical protein
MGASIRAFMHLADKKGYRLIGCVRAGFNAIFLRNDVGQSHFSSSHYNPRGCFAHWREDRSFLDEINRRRRVAMDHDWVDPAKTTRGASVADAAYGIMSLLQPLSLP